MNRDTLVSIRHAVADSIKSMRKACALMDQELNSTGWKAIKTREHKEHRTEDENCPLCYKEKVQSASL